MKQDCYKILQIPKTAAKAQIKKSFLSLALKYHPDKNKGNKLAERRFKQINEAYRILSDPSLRRSFDREWAARAARARQKALKTRARQNAVKTGRPAAPAAAPSAAPAFFSSKPRRAAQKEKPLNLSLSLPVSLSDLFAERKVLLNYVRPAGGKREKKRLALRLPKGVSPGQILKFKGKGGGEGSKAFGDLFVEVALKPHKLFSVRGKDVFLDMFISFCDALLLKEVSVPTVCGQIVMMAVPDKVRSGRLLRLKGLGMPLRRKPASGEPAPGRASSGKPDSGKTASSEPATGEPSRRSKDRRLHVADGGRGDMFVRFIVEFPENRPLPAADLPGLKRLPAEERRRLIQACRQDRFPKASQYKAAVAGFLKERKASKRL